MSGNEMKKIFVSLIAMVVASAVFVAAPTHAEALSCEVMGAFHSQVVENDTPDCINLRARRSSNKEDSVQSYFVFSSCDETFEMTAIDCASCDEEVTLEAPSEDNETGTTRTRFVLEGNDWDELEEGQTYQQYYEWELGDQEGVFTTETEFSGANEGGCESSRMCSTAGDSLPTDMVVLMALVFAVLGIRQGSFTPQA